MKDFSRTDPVPVLDVMPLIDWNWHDNKRIARSVCDIVDTASITDDIADKVCNAVNKSTVKLDRQTEFSAWRYARAARSILNYASKRGFKRFKLSHRRVKDGKLEFCFLMTVTYHFCGNKSTTGENGSGQPS